MSDTGNINVDRLNSEDISELASQAHEIAQQKCSNRTTRLEICDLVKAIEEKQEELTEVARACPESSSVEGFEKVLVELKDLTESLIATLNRHDLQVPLMNSHRGPVAGA